MAGVTLQSRAGSRNGFRSGVNTGRCLGLGARSRQGGIGIISNWFPRGRGGGQGLPPLISESPGFLRISAHPDRCFRRVPPEPPGQQQSLPPPVTEWVHGGQEYSLTPASGISRRASGVPRKGYLQIFDFLMISVSFSGISKPFALGGGVVKKMTILRTG